MKSYEQLSLLPDVDSEVTIEYEPGDSVEVVKYYEKHVIGQTGIITRVGEYDDGHLLYYVELNDGDTLRMLDHEIKYVGAK